MMLPAIYDVTSIAARLRELENEHQAAATATVNTVSKCTYPDCACVMWGAACSARDPGVRS
jgi:hypothetical protein